MRDIVNLQVDLDGMGLYIHYPDSGDYEDIGATELINEGHIAVGTYFKTTLSLMSWCILWFAVLLSHCRACFVTSFHDMPLCRCSGGTGF